MKYSIIIIGAILLAHFVAAQNQPFSQNLKKDYTLLRSKGKMPEFFTTSSTEKFKEDLEEIKAEDARRSEKKTKKKFVLKSNFLIDDMLQSGKVLYNDDVSNYVSKVANKLLKNEPKIKNSVQVLVIKSSNVNAFTTQGGLVFVTLGLIAQLENEAQLAYVLAHEFIHYKNNHVIEEHLEVTEIERGKKGYKSMDQFDRLLSKSNFSKEKEYEADKEGFKLYTKAGYSLKEAESVFDVLQYSYLPFDDEPFDKKFFNTKNIEIPEEYFLEEIAAIDVDEAYDDKLSSHPNIKSRRIEIRKMIEREDVEGKDVLISELEFRASRLYARLELCDIYLQSNSYAKAVYSIFLLKQRYPENKYLKRVMAKALYSLAKYKEFYDQELRSVKYEDVQGNSQQVYHLFNKLEAKDIMVLSALHAWELYLEDDSKFNKLQAEACLRSLVADFKYGTTDFYKKSKSKVQTKVEEVTENKDKEKSKYDKIKEQKIKSSIEGEDGIMNFAFVELFKNEEFSNTFDIIEEEYFEKKKEEERVKSKQELSKERKQKRMVKRKGLALGIDKVVLLDPYYMVTDERKKEQIKYIDAEQKQSQFQTKLAMTADKAGLDIELIDPKSFSPTDIDKYNDLSILNDWVREWSDINRFAEGEDFLNPNTEYTQYLVDKYDTEYFMWTGVITEREVKYGAGYYVLLTAIYFPLLPLGIAYAVTPKHSTYFYSVMFNVKTGQAEFVELAKTNSRDRNDIINSRLYDVFNQVKSKR